MLLRPTSFTAGALTSALLLYIGRQYLDLQSPRTPADYSTALNDTLKLDHTADQGELSEEEPYSVEKQVANSTFGFQKVIAIGLPERTDRRDTLRLLSAYQHVDLTWIDAVRGDQMARKAWPPHWHTGKNEGRNLSLAELGCWRSHSNALLQIIEKGYTSALIIEDDVDWDVGLTKQLNQFAEQSRILDNDLLSNEDRIDLDTRTTSPYGDNWDLLWLGPCANPPVTGNERAKVFVSEYGERHYVYPIEAGAACTFAYAVTQASARMLFGFMQNADKPVDFVMGDFCASGKECRIVWPQLISSRAIGRDSDIRQIEVKPEHKEGLKEGATWNVKNSAVLDMLGKTRPGKGKSEKNSDE